MHFWHRYVVIIFATLIVVCAVYLQAKMINIIHHLPIQSKYRHHRDRIWCRAPAIAQATITKVIRYIRHGMIREDVRNLNVVYRDIFGTFYRQIGIFKNSDCSSSCCSWFSMMLQIVNISDLGLDILYDFAPDWNGGKYSKLRYWSMMIYGSVERFCPFHLKRIHVLSLSSRKRYFHAKIHCLH